MARTHAAGSEAVCSEAVCCECECRMGGHAVSGSKVIVTVLVV